MPHETRALHRHAYSPPTRLSPADFSSSATVCGPPEFLPIAEDHRLPATNPYGWTRLFQENILRDLSASDPRWRIVLLR